MVVNPGPTCQTLLTLITNPLLKKGGGSDWKFDACNIKHNNIICNYEGNGYFHLYVTHTQQCGHALLTFHFYDNLYIYFSEPDCYCETGENCK